MHQAGGPGGTITAEAAQAKLSGAHRSRTKSCDGQFT